MKLISKFIIYPLIAIAVACLDLFTKYLIKGNFDTPGQSIEIAGNYLRFTLVYNKGITFGLFNGINGNILPFILIILAVLSLSIIIYLYFNISNTLQGRVPKIFGRISLMFIIGGASGNIIDRIINKVIVDFIDIGIGNRRWYTFNIADSFVVTGAIVIGVLLIFFEKKNEPPIQK